MKNEKIFFLPSFLFLLTFVLNLFVMPNQLIVLIAAFIALLVFLIVFVRRMGMQNQTAGKKTLHVLFFILVIPLIHSTGVFIIVSLPDNSYTGIIS